MLVLGLLPSVTHAEEKKVVIPFDFVSKFDDGRYGEMLGEMIWKKLQREGGFIIPETHLDTREFCKNHHITLAADTTIDQMKKIVREDFDAQIGIWGSVERVAGHETDVYDLVIKCVDFSGQPKVIFECSKRTNTVSEIPHLYVKQMLDALYDRKPGAPAGPNPVAEENWKKNPNLVVGGDFQQGSGKVPKGWEAAGGQQREPLGNLVKWLPEAGNPTNKVIRFTFDKGVGDSTGVMYYCLPFPVQEGATYRFQCRWRTNGPAAKVFIKCYDEIGSEYRRESEGGGKTAGRLRQKDYIPEAGQMREVYRSQQNLKGPKGQWNVQTEDFTPKHTKYTPKWGRVMLFAYLGGGVVEFDDVVVKQIAVPSMGETKERRHSLETKVTVKEMEENERRSEELKRRKDDEK